MIFYRPLAPIKALSFDLDDTLWDNGPIIRHATQALANFLRDEYPPIADLIHEHWQRHRNALVKQDPRLASDMSVLRHKILQALARQAGFAEQDQIEVADRGLAHFFAQRSAFKVNKNIYSLLERLSENIPLVAITNGNVDLTQVDIGQFFQQVYQANIDAPMKPDPAMFYSALAQLGLPAEEVLHVGDHLVKDVWAAHRLGFQTGWFACNREMNLINEPVRALPTVQLKDLEELVQILQIR